MSITQIPTSWNIKCDVEGCTKGHISEEAAPAINSGYTTLDMTIHADGRRLSVAKKHICKSCVEQMNSLLFGGNFRFRT